MIGIIYLITNLINGKQYIGQTTKIHLFNDYWGSGLLIKRAINKYGKENFKKEILKDNINSKLELDIFEKQYIQQYNTLIPIGYNISIGGNGGNLGPIINKIISKKKKGKIFVVDEYGKKFQINIDNQDYISGKLKAINGANISKSNKNRIRIYKNNTQKYILINQLDFHIKIGWKLGNIIPAAYTKTTRKAMYNTITNESKFIKNAEVEQYLNAGWIFGNPYKKHQNKKLYYNPITNEKKLISPNDIKFYIDLGWIIGGGKIKPQTQEIKNKIGLTKKGRINICHPDRKSVV